MYVRVRQNFIELRLPMPACVDINTRLKHKFGRVVRAFHCQEGDAADTSRAPPGTHVVIRQGAKGAFDFQAGSFIMTVFGAWIADAPVIWYIPNSGTLGCVYSYCRLLPNQFSIFHKERSSQLLGHQSGSEAALQMQRGWRAPNQTIKHHSLV